jgi:dTDP-4-dehydrorhamnose reductase
MGNYPHIHVTGAGGQVGRALAQRLSSGRFLNRDQLDIAAGPRPATIFRGAEIVIHLAAMTNVDLCEKEPQLCMKINGDGTRWVTQAAEAAGARVIYVSSDYVFDGEKTTEYTESDTPNPINAYGRSKLAGERHVASHARHLIVRTSWVFGDGHNFVRSIISAASRGEALDVVNDQRGRPTCAQDLAAALLHLAVSTTTGIVHVSGDGPVGTWADVAECALQAAHMKVPVNRINSAIYARKVRRPIAPRPRNSAFSLDKARSLAVPLSDWRSALSRFVEGR